MSVFREFLINNVTLLCDRVVRAPPSSRVVKDAILCRTFLFRVNFVRLRRLQVGNFGARVFVLSRLSGTIRYQNVTFYHPSPFLPLRFVSASLRRIRRALCEESFPREDRSVVGNMFRANPLRVVSGALWPHRLPVHLIACRRGAHFAFELY